MPITATFIGAFVSAFLATGAGVAAPPDSAHAGRALPIVSSGSPVPAHGKIIALKSQPGTQADVLARQLLAHELADAHRFGETPLVLVASAQLGAAHDGDVLFAQIQSPRECGSAGCSIASFGKAKGKWTGVPHSSSGWDLGSMFSASASSSWRKLPGLPERSCRPVSASPKNLALRLGLN